MSPTPFASSDLRIQHWRFLALLFKTLLLHAEDASKTAEHGLTCPHGKIDECRLARLKGACLWVSPATHPQNQFLPPATIRPRERHIVLTPTAHTVRSFEKRRRN